MKKRFSLKTIFSKISLKTAFLFFLGLCAVGILSGGILFFYLTKTLPTIQQITNREIRESTKIYDREGKVLLYEINGGQKRTVLSLEEIPYTLKDATIAIEDERFYEEPAFDWRGILRAIWVNLSHGEVRQGASTITQQLARNAFLSTEQTITRKLRELILAVRLSQSYSKDQILGLYLNEIPYGATIYGAEAASQAYFGKSAKNLTLAESAILASIPKAPTYYSPWGNHVKELFSRERLVLKKMRELNMISEKEAQAALEQKVVFQPQGTGIKAPHFVFAVQEYLVKKYGEGIVRGGGLVVTTSLDWKLQEAAERAVSEGVKRNEELYNGKNAALVAEDATNGQILALVGSRDYFDIKNEGSFNVATQGLRQPGSALKPFVYLTAFEKGYTPDTILFDVPTEFVPNNPICPIVPNFSEDNPKCFHPENFDEQFRGPVPMRRALAQSINIPAVKTLYLVGMKTALTTLQHFGLTTLTNPERYGLSLVLGGGEVRLIDLVGAYATLAREGVHHKQSLVLEVKNSKGITLERFNDESETVMDGKNVRFINDILSDINLRSGLFGGSLPLTTFPDQDVALKTGTSNDYRDAWAVGYTPSFTVGVWAGNNDNSPMQRRGSSILAAIPIWNAFLSETLKTRPIETFTRVERATSPKPILLGMYPNGQDVHSILYYVNRDNPGGPIPENPQNDSQFENWEVGVLKWVSENKALAEQLTRQSENSSDISYPNSASPLTILINSPSLGDFIKDELLIRASISSPTTITSIAIYLNNILIKEFKGDLPSQYNFTWSFTPPTRIPQNYLELEVINKNNTRSRVGVIVYQ